MAQDQTHMDTLTFTFNPVDRAALLRVDDEHVKALLIGGNARIVPVWNQKHLVSPKPLAQTLSYEQVSRLVDQGSEPLIFLGLLNDEPWFALGLKNQDLTSEIDPACTYVPLNDVVTRLPADEAAILAYARGMVIWHFNHMHCGRCGSPTLTSESGHSRVCSNAHCGYRSYPRTDPAVITLVSDGSRCLLGRQPQWPSGVYSTIAGFVEPGETLEETVRREVREETGIDVGNIRYIASQPWPFPSSIMLGFRADARTFEINCRDDELEDCRWFTREEIKTFSERNSSEPGFKLPNRYSIARFLIEGWMREQ